jgi:hypothetical protein
MGLGYGTRPKPSLCKSVINVRSLVTSSCSVVVNSSLSWISSTQYITLSVRSMNSRLSISLEFKIDRHSPDWTDGIVENTYITLNLLS